VSANVENKTDEIALPEEEIFRQRKDKLQRLVEEEGYNPYLIERWERADFLKDIRERFDHLGVDEADENANLTIAGRMMTLRKHGKAMFANLQDETDTMQLYFQLNAMGEEAYNFAKKWIDGGDFVGIVGIPFRTRRGELTLLVKECTLLSKALRPLPEKWHGLKDTEIRYRQRYLDLMVNPDVKDTFRKRSAIIASIRKTLVDHGTLEVETPILSLLAGGANARPFVTYHNALDSNMYLRIATELYLKRLVVGMFGRVFEIGKNFRNEGIDTMHNPEFTAMEVYWAYADYNDMMDLTEEIIRNAAKVVGEQTVTYQGVELDFSKPFRRVSMLDLVKEYADIDFNTIKTDEDARKIAREKGVELKGTESRFGVLNEVFEAFVEEKLVQPTFVLGHPTEISPLAKRDPENPDYTHRFELFIYGSEVANAFSELNDPLDQRERFLDQLRKKEEGDEEAHAFDEDFINAIECGLPPTGGLGIGIDRLVMFLTDSRSIRDVILFPTMRPKA
jgi:lysyl-tRNA synthetase class 2